MFLWKRKGKVCSSGYFVPQIWKRNVACDHTHITWPLWSTSLPLWEWLTLQCFKMTDSGSSQTETFSIFQTGDILDQVSRLCRVWGYSVIAALKLWSFKWWSERLEGFRSERRFRSEFDFLPALYSDGCLALKPQFHGYKLGVTATLYIVRINCDGTHIQQC